MNIGLLQKLTLSNSLLQKRNKFFGDDTGDNSIINKRASFGQWIRKLLLVILIISFSFPAFATTNKNNCSQRQRAIMSDIRRYYAECEIKENKAVSPGEDFDKLAKDMFDKGIIKTPYPKTYGDCSYGLDFDSMGDLKIYCAYHGDIKNADWFYRIKRLSNNNSLSFGFYVFIGLVFISFCISCIKGFHKIAKEDVQKKEQ